MDWSVVPLRSPVSHPENRSDEKSPHDKEALHTDGSVHPRSIEWSILGTEDGTKIRKRITTGVNLPMIPPMAPEPMFMAAATLRLDDPTTLFCWKVMMAGVLHCAPMTAKKVPRNRTRTLGPGITNAKPVIQRQAWATISQTRFWNLSARYEPPQRSPRAAI